MTIRDVKPITSKTHLPCMISIGKMAFEHFQKQAIVIWRSDWNLVVANQSSPRRRGGEATTGRQNKTSEIANAPWTLQWLLGLVA